MHLMGRRMSREIRHSQQTRGYHMSQHKHRIGHSSPVENPILVRDVYQNVHFCL